MGAQVLFKSTDRGSSWQKISGDLTLDVDRDTLKMMGSVVGTDALSRHDGQSNYGSLTSIGESPVDPLVIYTGSDDGQVQRHEGRRKDLDEHHGTHSGRAAADVREHGAAVEAQGRPRVRHVRRTLHGRLPPATSS